jgi:hypothetical protein
MSDGAAAGLGDGTNCMAKAAAWWRSRQQPRRQGRRAATPLTLIRVGGLAVAPAGHAGVAGQQGVQGVLLAQVPTHTTHGSSRHGLLVRQQLQASILTVCKVQLWTSYCCGLLTGVVCSAATSTQPQRAQHEVSSRRRGMQEAPRTTAPPPPAQPSPAPAPWRNT